MKIIGNVLERTFLIEYHGKVHHINYLNADYPNPNILNRENWKIFDENGEELDIFIFKSDTKKEIKKIKSNRKIFNILTNFCIKNFNVYNPEPCSI